MRKCVIDNKSMNDSKSNSKSKSKSKNCDKIILVYGCMRRAM